MLRYLFIYIFTALITSEGLFAQDVSRIPKLKTELASATSDSDMADALSLLSFSYSILNTDTALMYGNNAMELSEKINYAKGIADSYNVLGWTYFHKGDYTKAETYLKTSLEKFRVIGNKVYIKKPLSNLATLYAEKTEYDKSLTCLREILQYDDEIKDKGALGRDLYQVGRLYNLLHNYKTAREYFEKAYENSKAVNDEVQMAEALMTIGNTWQSEGNQEAALKYYTPCLQYLQKQKDYYRTGLLYENMGGSYVKLKNYDAAAKNYGLAKENYKKIDSKTDMFYACIGLSDVYTALQDSAQALAQLHEALQYASQLSNQKLKQQVMSNLSDFYYSRQDYKSAYHYIDSTYAIKDSLFTLEKQNELLKLQTQFETERKEKQNQLLKAENTLKEQETEKQKLLKNIFIIGAVLLLLLAIVLVNRYRIKQKAAKELEEKNAIIEKEKQRAEKSEQFKSEFLANMSHEIRTPMNAVMGITNLLLHEPQNEKNLRYLHAIKNASDNLLIVINDILDLSKMEAGKMELEKIPFRLTNIATSIYDTFYLKAAEKNIQFIIDIESTLPPVLIGDPARLTQILLNLAGNAVKFTDKGSVVVHLKKATGQATETELCTIYFSVEDTGPGIEEEKLSTIFESFTQVHASGKYGGTGLGLTISKKLIGLYNGVLHAESKPGAGAVFSFMLKFETGTQEQLDEYYAEKEGYTADDLFGIKILLAEDNEDNRLVAVDTLKNIIEEVEIDVVHNGAAVLEKLKQQYQNTHYDLILMDVQMPVLDGLETTRQIRNNFPLPINTIPVIALTASVLRSDLQKCIEAGINGYIPKPFTEEMLIREIGIVLQKSTAQNNKTKDNTLTEKKHFASNAITVQPTGVDFDKPEQATRNNKEKLKEYLLQFQELVPGKIKQLLLAAGKNDRSEIYQCAHSLKPQLAFFGLKKEEWLANIIEMNAADITMNELTDLIFQLKNGCEAALTEVENKLKSMEP
jgi:signal transduction histidine kinase/DNA-binding response OmpR family regulator